jgi:hypothetical protein
MGIVFNICMRNRAIFLHKQAATCIVATLTIKLACRAGINMGPFLVCSHYLFNILHAIFHTELVLLKDQFSVNWSVVFSENQSTASSQH